MRRMAVRKFSQRRKQAGMRKPEFYLWFVGVLLCQAVELALHFGNEIEVHAQVACFLAKISMMSLQRSVAEPILSALLSISNLLEIKFSTSFLSASDLPKHLL